MQRSYARQNEKNADTVEALEKDIKKSWQLGPLPYALLATAATVPAIQTVDQFVHHVPIALQFAMLPVSFAATWMSLTHNAMKNLKKLLREKHRNPRDPE